MNHRHDLRERGSINAFMRGVRAFAEASLVALAFGIGILLIGTPIALIFRVVHEGLSWLARLGGDPSGFGEALVSVVSIAGSLAMTAVVVRLLVGLFRWRSHSTDQSVIEGDRLNARRVAGGVTIL